MKSWDIYFSLTSCWFFPKTASSASSKNDISQQGRIINIDELGGTYEKIDRSLGAQCSPVHSGSQFSDLFLNGDQWESEGNVYETFWKECNLVFAFEDHGTKYLTTLKDGTLNTDVFQFDYYSQAYDKFQNNEVTCPNCANAVITLVNGVSQEVTVISNNTSTEQNLATLISDAATAYIPYEIGFSFSSDQVELLLNGFDGLLRTDKWTGVSSASARISSRNQIKVFHNSTFELNRRFVNKYSGYLFSPSFNEMHNSTGGANRPPFSRCIQDWFGYVSPNQVVHPDSETAFCCGRQCTHDISSKSWSTVSCKIPVNNCYNTMLESCQPETRKCEQLVANPEDQFPTYREPFPHKNVWTFFARHEMTGGVGTDDSWQRWVRNDSGDPVEYTTIEGHHTLPYEQVAHGNGRYEITFVLKQGSLTNQWNLPLVKIIVFSWNTGMIMNERLLLAGSIPTDEIWTPITFELTLADRHVDDIGFRIEMQPDTTATVGFDYVRVKYLFYETFAPTEAPTPYPTSVSTTSPSMVPTGCDHSFKVSVFTDQYPQETSWRVTTTRSDGSSYNVLTGGPYGTGATWNESHGCLQSSKCYRFTIMDAAGDGICCGYGSGDYRVELAEGAVDLLDGQQIFEFGQSWSYDFCAPSSAA